VGAAVISAGVPIAQDGPADLTILSVERTPAIPYVQRSEDPRVEGWPASGQQVVWRAHLKNWSGRRISGVDFTWSLDGAVVASGSVDVEGGREALVDFPWAWEPRRHRLELVVDAGHRVTVRGGNRNRVLIHTDALPVGFYVERGFYDYFRAHQHQLRIGNSSFEDWAHAQIDFYNTILEKAVYPETPDGVLDRVRLDRITIVPDRALPLDPLALSIGGSFTPSQARPNVGDRTVDLQWGFPLQVVELGVYNNVISLDTDNQSYYSGFLQHELGHARYLIDVYAFNVFHGTSGSRVEITEGGAPVAGSRHMPGSPAIHNGVPGLLLHETPYKGLMNAQWTYMDRYSAAAWNLIAGRRATLGNYNEPENLGVFLNDLPRENRVTLRDTAGAALGGACVRVYQSAPGDQPSYYSMRFDDVPDLERTADGDGRVLLGPNPFSRSGRIVHSDGWANGVVILRVERDGRVGYAFLEVTELNLEYWRGRTDVGEYELHVDLS
jgi:hypothetical protein